MSSYAVVVNSYAVVVNIYGAIEDSYGVTVNGGGLNSCGGIVDNYGAIVQSESTSFLSTRWSTRASLGPDSGVSRNQICTNQDPKVNCVRQVDYCWKVERVVLHGVDCRVQGYLAHKWELTKLTS